MSRPIKLPPRANDLTGWRVGMLVAEYPIRVASGIVWFCSCDCGGSVERSSSLLSQADWGLQHCGCERQRPLPEPIVNISEQEKAYFAGYTDAEGCIGMYTATHRGSVQWFSSVGFSQTQPTVIERLHRLYGGTLRVCERGLPRRPQKHLAIQAFNAVRRFLLDIGPYLREKRVQADIVINDFNHKAPSDVNQALKTRLSKLKANRLGEITILPRLSITPQKHLRCFDCTEDAFSRGFCEKHYWEARRAGRITTNPKGTGVPFIYGRPLKDYDSPYFAGYFDGDGCIAISSEKNRWYPRITFHQTQPDTLIELHAVYGGSLTLEKARDATRRPKLAYQLVQRAAVFALLRDIRPFVVEKRDQVELFLARYRPEMSFEDGKMLKEQLSEMKQRSFGSVAREERETRNVTALL